MDETGLKNPRARRDRLVEKAIALRDEAGGAVPQLEVADTLRSAIYEAARKWGLTPPEQRFVISLASTGRALLAAKLCGFKNPRKSAARLMGRKPVRMCWLAVQNAMMRKLFATAEQVNGSLSEIAFGDRTEILGALLSLSAPEPVAGKDRDGSKRAAARKAAFSGWMAQLNEACAKNQVSVKSLKVQETDGGANVVISFESRTDALAQLSRNLGLMKHDEDKAKVEIFIDLSGGPTGPQPAAIDVTPDRLEITSALEMDMGENEHDKRS